MESWAVQHKRRSEPNEVRRLQLIVATIDSIWKRGFSDTTLKRVTEAANVSHGVVNYHFDSKEALYDATLGFLAQEHYENWVNYHENAKSKPAHRLEAVVRADFDKNICTQKRLAVWFAFWGQAKYRPSYLKIHNKYEHERYDRIHALCTELIKDGRYADLDTDQVARVVEALSNGAWLSLMLYPKTADRVTYRKSSLFALSRLFQSTFRCWQAIKNNLGGAVCQTKFFMITQSSGFWKNYGARDFCLQVALMRSPE